MNHYIEFPKLFGGIRLEVGPVAFPLPEFLGIGPIRVHWYGIIIAVAIIFSLILGTKQASRFRIREEDLLDMFLIALPVSVIFSRLFYVVFKFDEFKNNLVRILYIWEGGVAIYGAVIGAVLSVFIFSRIRKINMWVLCDFACVYLPLSQAIGRWGNFFNQELYGKGTNLPWGMTGSIIRAETGSDQLVHPTFLYESLWNVLVFFVLLFIRKRNKVPGRVFASYLLLYSFGRFMIEFLRVDDFQSANDVRYNQAFAAVLFAGALIFIIISVITLRIRKKTPVYDTPSAYADILKNLDGEESERQETNSHDTTPALGDNDNRDAAAEPVIDSGGEKPEGPPEAAESTELQDEDTGSDKPDSADGVE
ncbi:MAG: prolipoprotein diacylglyceryl transferase [Clostridiaceae bacterium]|jgi:phosphatidylglycerol:prolipoprotein diacylglycerol transferase|nr:prolipoprotein diacylglyceryl transferase [Clostridiaceae bacterium]